MTHPTSRRAFLQRASLLSMAGAAAPWALNLAAMSEAAAATATDYKALVCVFLYGGNDYANTLVPYDPPSYNAYYGMRKDVAYLRSELDPFKLDPTLALPDSRQYALAPALGPLLKLFATDKKLGVLLNVGTLTRPTSKSDFTTASPDLPPKLFSHNDQQSYWQSAARPEGASSGWGGRMGDKLMGGNVGSSVFTCVNVTGNAVFLSGQNAVQYQVSSSGPVVLAAGPGKPLFGSQSCSDALLKLITAERSQVLEKAYNAVTDRALKSGAVLGSALAAGPVISTAFAADNPLALQLKMVAKMISTADTLNVKRQVFFVALGGFDTHDGLKADHPPLLAAVADAMAAFQAAMVELKVDNQVTAFTASDFGRTLTANDGSDHGWGSMHFMLGGAVKGGRFYGQAPLVANNGDDDVGQGRLLPSTSVDQYAATLGKWFGVSDTDLLEVLPNLKNWDVSKRNLDFV